MKMIEYNCFAGRQLYQNDVCTYVNITLKGNMLPPNTRFFSLKAPTLFLRGSQEIKQTVKNCFPLKWRFILPNVFIFNKANNCL